MVKSLFNSLSIPKECCNLKSKNELVLLIISLANLGFKSHVSLKKIQNDKQEGQHSIHLIHKNNILCSTSLSLPKECCNLKSTNELVLLIISLANPGFKSHVNLETIQNEKQEGQHSIHINP